LFTRCRILGDRGGGAAQRVGGPTLAMECEKWILKHIAIVNDFYGGLGACPQEKFHILEALRVYF